MSFQTNLYQNISKEQWPIIYRKEYNVNFVGLEKFHPFDAHKWNNIYKVPTEKFNFSNTKTLINFST